MHLLYTACTDFQGQCQIHGRPAAFYTLDIHFSSPSLDIRLHNIQSQTRTLDGTAPYIFCPEKLIKYMGQIHLWYTYPRIRYRNVDKISRVSKTNDYFSATHIIFHGIG